MSRFFSRSVPARQVGVGSRLDVLATTPCRIVGSISPAGHCLAGGDVRRVVAPPGVGFDGVGDQYFHDVSRGSIRLLDHDVAARVARGLPFGFGDEVLTLDGHRACRVSAFTA